MPGFSFINLKVAGKLFCKYSNQAKELGAKKVKFFFTYGLSRNKLLNCFSPNEYVTLKCQKLIFYAWKFQNELSPRFWGLFDSFQNCVIT